MSPYYRRVRGEYGFAAIVVDGLGPGSAASSGAAGVGTEANRPAASLLLSRDVLAPVDDGTVVGGVAAGFPQRRLLDGWIAVAAKCGLHSGRGVDRRTRVRLLAGLLAGRPLGCLFEIPQGCIGIVGLGSKVARNARADQRRRRKSRGAVFAGWHPSHICVNNLQQTLPHLRRRLSRRPLGKRTTSHRRKPQF